MLSKAVITSYMYLESQYPVRIWQWNKSGSINKWGNKLTEELLLLSIELSLTLCDPIDCSMPGFPVLHYLPEFAQTYVHWVGDAIQPSHPLLSPFPPDFSLSQHQGLFSWVDSLYQMAKVSELQLQHQSSNEYSALISFRIDRFDLLAVQGTLKSLLQHHSSKASILQRSALFIVQLSHPYMTTGKNHSFDYMNLCWQSDASAF